MTIDDLEPGDVLLFSPEPHSWISEAIVLLTGAPVSHAALAYDPSTSLIESTLEPPGVNESSAAKRFPGRKITVRRPSPPDPIDPVLHAAARYRDEKQPYAMDHLYLVGMLLLYKKFTPTSAVQKAMLKVFRHLAASVMRRIDEREHPGKLPMVCSEFVFQCFEDAGEGYALKIEGGLFAARATSLLQQAMTRPPAASSALGVAAPAAGTGTGEELARELVETLRAAEADGPLLATAPQELDPELTGAVHEFAAAVHRASRPATTADPVAGLALLAGQEACFVTPADLLLHCPALDTVGEIEMPAVEEEVHA